MGPEDMPVQSTPKEVDPGDVALSPEDDICEEIYQRVLAEVRARIDDRIAAIEAQTAADAVETAESGPADSEHVDVPPTARRRPVMRAAITLLASAGLVGAAVTLARDHTESITSVTDRIEAAVQSIRRENPPMAVPTSQTETAANGSSAAQTAEMAPASPSPSASPTPESPARSSDPSSAMAEATSERDMPPAPDRDVAPLMEKIAHDVAELQTALQELKANQEQAHRDHTKAIEQLQASQDQLARAFRTSKTEATTVGAAAAARLAPRPPLARPPRF